MYTTFRELTLLTFYVNRCHNADVVIIIIDHNRDRMLR